MGEDSDAVEGAVVLWVVQPALETVGAMTPDPYAHDVRGAAADMTINHQVPRQSTGLLASIKLPCGAFEGKGGALVF